MAEAAPRPSRDTQVLVLASVTPELLATGEAGLGDTLLWREIIKLLALVVVKGRLGLGDVKESMASIR